VEVVRDAADEYVRDAVTLERLEYCILLDENGNKRFIQGPAVVFPAPTETFVERAERRKFKAIELNENSGIYVKVIAPYTEAFDHDLLDTRDCASACHEVNDVRHVSRPSVSRPIEYHRRMHLSLHVCLVLMLSFFAGCGRTAAPPSTAPHTAVNASPGATTDSAAAASAPGSADIAALRARLPSDAAIVGWLRPTALDLAARWMWGDAALPMWIATFAPTRTISEVLSTLGIDAQSPVALALVGPDLARASEALDAIVKGGAPPAQGVVTGEVSVHVIARALPGVDLRTKARALGEVARATVVSCPSDPRCQVFAERGPDVVLSREGAAIAAWSREGRVELVIAFGHRLELGLDALLGVLAQRRRLAVGPPAGRCAALDPNASLSLCVHADGVADAGAAIGLALTANALSQSIDVGVRAELAAQGRKESMRPLELAKPEKRLLDDGTLSVVVSPKDYRITASWLVVDAAARERLPAERCSDTPDLAGLVPTLMELFPDRGSDFRDVAARVQHVREGGLGALLSVFARTWPNLVDAARVEPRFSLMLPGAETACLGMAGDRLELRIAGRPIPFIKL
jgi:hypothetical protein